MPKYVPKKGEYMAKERTETIERIKEKEARTREWEKKLGKELKGN